MSLFIAAAMVLCWLLGILHPAMVGFIGAFLFCAIGLEFDAAFHGFGTEMPWFLYGALLLVGAADRSGLTQAIGARTPRAFSQSPLVPTVIIVALAYALALVVPSSLARATMLILLALAWAGDSAVLRTSLVFAAGYGAGTFGHPDLAGGPFSIAGWDVAAAVALVCVVAWNSRRGMTIDASAAPSRPPAAGGVISWKLAVPVLVAVLLWLTTPFHHVSPALVGLACGLVSWLPGIAAPGEHSPKADHLAIIFAGTALTIPAVLIETRSVDLLTRGWLAMNQALGMLPAPLGGYWSSVVYRLFSPDGARPALPSLSNALGSTAIWSYAGSTLLSLHQSPALILAMVAGGCRPKHVVTAGLFVLMLGSVVVMLF